MGTKLENLTSCKCRAPSSCRPPACWPAIWMRARFSTSTGPGEISRARHATFFSLATRRQVLGLLWHTKKEKCQMYHSVYYDKEAGHYFMALKHCHVVAFSLCPAQEVLQAELGSQHFLNFATTTTRLQNRASLTRKNTTNFKVSDSRSRIYGRHFEYM